MDYESLHRELWNWLAENTEYEKKQWPGWKNIHEHIEDLCFACKLAGTIQEKYKERRYHLCNYCPLEWPNHKICAISNSLFQKWKRTYVPKEKKKFALQIANLKWVEHE